MKQSESGGVTLWSASKIVCKQGKEIVRETGNESAGSESGENGDSANDGHVSICDG